FNGMEIGAFWALYPIFFLLLQIHGVLISGIVQSSEKSYRAITRNLAILFVLYNAGAFVIFGVLRTVWAYRLEAETGVPEYLTAYCIFQLVLAIYVSVYYKKPIIGWGLLAFMMFLMISGNNASLWDTLGFTSGLSVGAMVGITGIVSVLSPVLFYGLSVAMYKWPYSDYIVSRLMRLKGA
ncbi:MAG: hypothetical protein J6M66_13380, partial [Lachnospiraceae bacterium]|nr:hypothetical protein [Lachnospiraceae bacterium]